MNKYENKKIVNFWILKGILVDLIFVENYFSCNKVLRSKVK